MSATETTTTDNPTADDEREAAGAAQGDDDTQATPQGEATPDDVDEPVDEPAEPDDDTNGDGEPDEPVEPAGLSEKDIEKSLAALAREAERHGKRVVDIMGDDEAATLVPCELCRPDIPGYRFQIEPSEDVKQAVRAAIGLPTLETFEPATDARQCDKCAGKGKVRTQSLVPGHEVVRCLACEGRGWVAVGPERVMGGLAVVANGADAAAPPPVDDGIERDMFGTPITDPDYGKMPGMRARPIEYWQEHAS